MLIEKNLLSQINNSNGDDFLISQQDIQAYPLIKEIDETSEFKININKRFQNLLKMLQLIMVKRYLKINDQANNQIKYQECFILIFLLVCGCVNEKSGIDFERGDRKLDVASNVFGNRFFSLLAEKHIETAYHKIPSEGVHEGIFNQLSTILSVKVSRLIKHENKKYFIDLLDDNNEIMKEKLSIIYNKIKEYCKDKTKEVINGAFEIYSDLQTDLEKYCGKRDPQVQKLILK